MSAEILKDTTTSPEKSHLLEVLKFHEHHMHQVDRLLHIVELLKIENKYLRTRLQNSFLSAKPEKIKEIKPACIQEIKQPVARAQKPRVTCRPAEDLRI